MAIGSVPNLEELSNISKLNEKTAAGGDKEIPLSKDEVNFDMLCISYDSRLETEEEIKKRKDDFERLAALDKNAKKKPAAPAKGQAAVSDPMDEAQMIKVAVENNMDMGNLMPLYSKWATSQLQFIKDRSIRDTESRESIW